METLFLTTWCNNFFKELCIDKKKSHTFQFKNFSSQVCNIWMFSKLNFANFWLNYPLNYIYFYHIPTEWLILKLNTITWHPKLEEMSHQSKEMSQRLRQPGQTYKCHGKHTDVLLFKCKKKNWIKLLACMGEQLVIS